MWLGYRVEDVSRLRLNCLIPSELPCGLCPKRDKDEGVMYDKPRGYVAGNQWMADRSNNLLRGLEGVAAEGGGKVQFGFDLGEDFAVFAGLLKSEFAVLATEGEIAVVSGPGGPEFGFDTGDSGVQVLLGQFAFPDRDDRPCERVETLGVELVPGDVPRYLRPPEIDMGLGHDIFGAPPVPMPEAPVDEDDRPVLRQHQIRRPRQPPVIEPIPISPPPQLAPHDPFGRRVPGTNARHALVPLGRGEGIGHMQIYRLRAACAKAPLPSFPA